MKRRRLLVTVVVAAIFAGPIVAFGLYHGLESGDGLGARSGGGGMLGQMSDLAYGFQRGALTTWDDLSHRSKTVQRPEPLHRFSLSRFVQSVPEPDTWAMMILGFAATGSVLRRRRAGRRA